MVGLVSESIYWSNENAEAKTATISLSLTPKIEKMLSASVTSIISQGRNLADDEGFYTSCGMKKQTDGYWKGEQSRTNAVKGTLWENVHRIPGQFTISFTGKWLTSENNSSPPFVVVCRYTDGTDDLWLDLTSKTSVRTKYTKVGKTVEKFYVTFGNYGTFEIKDLMLNIGTTALPYEPYSYTKKIIPSAITSIDGYGDVGNLLEFDKLEYTQKKKRIVFTGNETRWYKGSSGNDVSIYHIALAGKKDASISECTYFTFLDYGDEIFEPVAGTFADFFIGEDIAFYSDIPTLEGWKEYLAQLNDNGAPLTVLYELEDPVITDVSGYDINPISIVDDGIIIFDNEANLDVPNTIQYVTRRKK